MRPNADSRILQKWYRKYTISIKWDLWDDNKRRQVLNKRSIDFADLDMLLDLPYIEDRRLDDPKQHRIIGFVRHDLTTFIVEYREDKMGEYLWVVTGWKSTKQEKKAYEKEIG
jgi:uncharacterized DUF497 family protein